MKILITAFDPFGGESVNPAELAVSRLSTRIAGAEIIKLIVPTVFGASTETVLAAIEAERPDAVICIGQAGGRCAITPERVAVNVIDARIADNAGNRPVDEPVIKSGPDAYFSTLPIKAIVERIRESGIPASVSESAGTFVCNALMYGILHALKTRFSGIIGGFIHIPFAPVQVADKTAPSMSLNDVITGIEAAVSATVDALKNKQKQ
ncbi:MAG: pyroglutamyl-peptidase I [Clostridia bacterium]|nr:pyroglutamyl-peptidase I [Clostridia bacterium]